MRFAEGDTVVYPQHGVGRIVGIVEQDHQGKRREYYRIQIPHNELSVMVPVEGAEKAGIRPVISEAEVEEVLGVLRNDATSMPVNWNRRIKHNQEKIKSGNIFEIADVLRNLTLRNHKKGLSSGEKQMLRKVRHILASELMYAKHMAEEEAVGFIDGILAEICARADGVGEEAAG